MKKSERAEESKNRILEAAEAIFSARGLAGARVDEIAADAGINKRMIYHYFQSKENLYLEVLKRNFLKVYRLALRVGDIQGTAREKAAQVITRYFYFLAENPAYVRLITWDMLESGQYARRALSGYLKDLEEEMARIFAEGVGEGTFRSDLDIKKIIVSANTLCLSYFTRGEIMYSYWDRDRMQPEMLEAWLQHVLALIFQGISVKTPCREG